MKKIVTSLMLTIYLTSLFGFAFNVQLAKAWTTAATVYIRADGSVDPPAAPVQREGDLYTLNDNIVYGGDDLCLVVEKNDVVVDGAGYSVQGTTYSGTGIDLAGRSNVTIRNIEITGFEVCIRLSMSSNNLFISGNIIASSAMTGVGVFLDSSSDNYISGNDISAFTSVLLDVSSNYNHVYENIITNGAYGVYLDDCSYNRISGNNVTGTSEAGILLGLSSDNTVSGNNIVANYGYGIWLANSSDNKVYHNNFVGNEVAQAYVEGTDVWDNGYPYGGNYWFDYNGSDLYSGSYQNEAGSDGIGDTPYFISGPMMNWSVVDKYPLMDRNQLGEHIIVSNTVEGATPPDPWNYVIKDADTGALVDTFTLPAAGKGRVSSSSRGGVGHFYSITQGGVTQTVEPIQGSVSAQAFYAYDTGSGSGFAPYMETGKSKIYLYEDTTTRALSLVIHHNKYLGPVNFWVNMTLNGLPIGADVLLQDDPTPEDHFGLAGGGVLFGWWSGGNFSDGGILGGLGYPESIWNITAQMLWTDGISAWEYQTASGPIALNMAEPVTISSFTAPAGFDYLIAQHKKLGCDTTIIVNGTIAPKIADNLTDMTNVTLGPSDTISVVFNNIPSAALGRSAGGTGASVGWTCNIPCRVPVPVQAAMGPDISYPKDGKIDLVEGKPTAIFVNVSDVLQYVASGEFVDISISDTKGLFNLLSPPATGAELAKNNIMIFYPNPPSIAGDDEITVAISKGPSLLGPWTPSSSWVPPVSTIPTKVTVKNTSELALYYACLNRTDYGTENEANYGYMFGNSTDFINATYPVSNLIVDPDYKNLVGNQSTPGSTLALLRDCQWLAQLAKLKFPKSVAVGIGIGPNTTVSQTYSNYFAYHGATDKKGNVAVGVSFGPSTRGVVVMDGYYTAAAHELAHTFNLYYGVPEQYVTDYPGKTANGFNVVTQQLCMGYDFMGLAPYRTTNITWVNTTSTFEYLFRNTTVNKNDPEILLVNGIIYQNGTVEFPLTWYHLEEGTPDTLPPGNFALRFVASDGTTILGTTSFDAPFFMMIDPGMGVGEDLPDVSGFGKVDTDFAGFSFATAYPSGTATVELVNMTDPVNENVIATVNVADTVFLPETTETQSGTEGSNGWYTSNVDVTLAATATLGVKEIHYELGGTLNVVQGATATFTISTEGTHSLSYWAVDNSENTETPHSQTIRIDKNPPAVELTLPQPLLNQPASATWIATDSISGVDGPTSGTIVIDTSSVGLKTVTVTVKDNAGNSITATKTCYVTYAFVGFLEPINNDDSSIFKLGSTVPVKFQLVDAQGSFISTAVAKIYVTKLTNAVTGDEVEPVSTSTATTGNLFRYDSTSNQYIFNLGTKSLSRGTWQIKVVLDDGTTKTVLISLR